MINIEINISSVVPSTNFELGLYLGREFHLNVEIVSIQKKTWFDEISGYHDFIQSYMEFICFVEQQINSKN